MEQDNLETLFEMIINSCNSIGSFFLNNLQMSSVYEKKCDETEFFFHLNSSRFNVYSICAKPIDYNLFMIIASLLH